MTNRGVGLIFMGIPGIGKTSLAMRFKKPNLTLSLQENGFEDLDDAGLVPEGCFNKNIYDYDTLKKEITNCSYSTLHIDGLTGFQKIWFQYICTNFYKNDMKNFWAYSSGPRREGVQYLPEFIQLLDSARNRGVNVVISSHSAVDKEIATISPDILTSTLSLDKGIREVFEQWAQGVFYMSRMPQAEIVTETVGRGDNTLPKTIKPSTYAPRVMYVEQGAGHVAKNRLNMSGLLNLPDDPDEAFKVFKSALPPKLQERIADEPKAQSVQAVQVVQTVKPA